MNRLTISFLIVVSLLCVRFGSADDSFNWDKTENTFALKNHDKIVWQFNRGTEGSKPYFHPISLPDGTVLTEPRPVDHPWHLALWFSWKYLNGLNYWEETKETHQAQGVTELTSVRYEPHEDFSASIFMDLEYHPPGKESILSENRRVEISRPDSDCVYRIDWSSRFTAKDKTVLFDRTPILGEKNGVEYGGYAGLSVRFSNSVHDCWVSDLEGRQSMNIGKYRVSKLAPWMDYTFQLPNGDSAGIGIIDHPSNPRHPSPWYAIVNPDQPFYYYSPAFLHEQPFELSAGEKFELRYRIVVHSGRTNAQFMETETKAFRKKDK